MASLSLLQAADALGISYRTAQRWTRRGWLKAHRLPNGRLLIQADDIARLLGQEAGHV
jgi:excisionase family DNA binding protein